MRYIVLLSVLLPIGCGPIGVQVAPSVLVSDHTCQPGCEPDRYDTYLDEEHITTSYIPTLDPPYGTVVRIEARCRKIHSPCCGPLEGCLRFQSTEYCSRAWEECGLSGEHFWFELEELLIKRCIASDSECCGVTEAPGVLVLRNGTCE